MNGIPSSLFHAYIDGELVASEECELIDWLRLDRANVDLFVAECRLHSELCEKLWDNGRTDGVGETEIEIPFPSLSPVTSPISSPFVGGPVFSYLVAMVVLCMMLLGAWAYKITRDAPIAINEPTPSLIEEDALRSVARITGMKDCKWPADAIVPMVGSYISLGRKYSLDAGLLEITYKSGARVILEGPCVYKVDSDAGGYLAVGRLTAMVKSRGLAASAAGAKPQAAPPELRDSSLILRPSSLFTVTTPTATVTDLGTEFGVEVKANGDTVSHVFQGSVEVMPVGGNAGDAVLLSKNDSIRVEKTADGGKPFVVRGKLADKPSRFVRNIPRPRRNFLDLADIVAGGDGFGNERNRGIEYSMGKIAVRPPKKYTHHSKGRYISVDELPLVDGIFIPDGGNGSVQIDSAGHSYSGFTDTCGKSWNYLWSGQLPMTETAWISCWLGNTNYANRGHSVISIPPNKGVTFDLKAICRKHEGMRLVRFTAAVGNAEIRSDNPMASRASADLWVFIDGRLRFHCKDITSIDGVFGVDVPLQQENRFLTLVATDAGNGTEFDWTMFGDPRLHIQKPNDETDNVINQKENPPMQTAPNGLKQNR